MKNWNRQTGDTRNRNQTHSRTGGGFFFEAVVLGIAALMRLSHLDFSLANVPRVTSRAVLTTV